MIKRWWCPQVIALGADSIDLEFCLDLMDVADQYLVGSLQRLCEDTVMMNITVRALARHVRFDGSCCPPSLKKKTKMIAQMLVFTLSNNAV